jgi:hypothetical protein
VTLLAVEACGGKAKGHVPFDNPPDVSAARATDAAPSNQDEGALMDANAPSDEDAPALMDATAPTEKDAPALDVNFLPLDALDRQSTLYPTRCVTQDAQVAAVSTCPCNGSALACSRPDAGSVVDCSSTDLQGQTCETLGFLSGTLGCSASCSFDTSACDSCVAVPRTACASLHVADGLAAPLIDWGHPVTTPNATFAVAASDTEIALAWADGNGALHFARFGANLSLLSDDCIAAMSFDAVSVAPTSTGWLVAAHASPDIFLYLLDHKGTATGGGQVVWEDKEAGDPCGYTRFADGLTLSSTPAGDLALLTWGEMGFSPYCGGHGSLSQVVAEDGHAIGAFNGGLPAPTSIAATPEGFEAVWYYQVGVRLKHIALDGTVREDATFGMSTTDWARVAWSGSEIRLLYGVYGATGAGFLQAVSAAVAPIGNPVPINTGGYALDHDVLLAIGPDTVVHLTQSANSHFSEYLVRLDARGTPALPPVPVVAANYAATLKAVAQGGDAIVAWIDGSTTRPARIQLARVRLTP